jgi:hypothetical protein
MNLTREETLLRINAPAPVQVASLGELFDWINVNSADVFVKNADGELWVTYAERLTPALEAALNVHRESLMPLVADKPMEAGEFERALNDALTI